MCRFPGKTDPGRCVERILKPENLPKEHYRSPGNNAAEYTAGKLQGKSIAEWSRKPAPESTEDIVSVKLQVLCARHRPWFDRGTEGHPL